MNNIIEQKYFIDQAKRNQLNGHRSLLIWFTGLSGSGKSTIANHLQFELHKNGLHVYTLDGDNIRLGLNKDLGFSPEDRGENLRRIAEVAKLMIDAGILTIGAFVSPIKADRELIKRIVGEENFIEIFINTSLEECEKRDVKGLYKKARTGEIKNFTGISAPYEIPDKPDLVIRTEDSTIENSIQEIMQLLKDKLLL